MAEPIITLLENWDETHTLTRDEAIAILELPDEQLPQLIETAYVLRTKYKGKKVSIQLLTNVRSGNCSQNCAYCAQSCESKAPIEKYRRISDGKAGTAAQGCRPEPDQSQSEHEPFLLSEYLQHAYL